VNLELRADQAEFQRQVAAFAAETVAPPAQAIDETNQFPRDIVQAARQPLRRHPAVFARLAAIASGR